MDDIGWLDATAQAELVRRKEISPIELIDSAIKRIKRQNPVLNAVITPLYEQARKAAAAPLPNGPLAGVPFLLKDLMTEYAGAPLTAGSAFLSNRYIPDRDCELVKRYKRAGLIIVGKANTSEFGVLPTTEPRHFGPTRNPWDLEKTAGGSSGGSSAAVAAGLVPAAHANDGGGSIRIAASCCGLFGLNPTRARTPLGPQYGSFAGGLAGEHAITRSVRDSAALLDAAAGPDLGDPYWAPPPKRDFMDELGEPPGSLRIAFSTGSQNGLAMHPDCLRAVKDAASLCAQLGHQVGEAAPKFDGPWLVERFKVLRSVECAWQIDDWARRIGRTPQPDYFEPVTWAFYELGRRTSASAYLLAWEDLQRMARDLAGFFTEYDIYLTPPLAEPPVPIGTFSALAKNPLEAVDRIRKFAPFTMTSSVTGQPSMSMPLFWTERQLPIGVLFTGRFGDEATLLRLAAQLESARPWAQRRPERCAAPL
ncbi:MAG: amidase [Elusimicrobia bacterium RIFCSPHIGHO2_02_FULL_57_9]|nr:MAG: amidase [Elusimicrobia bacterium RIFCSPHIGHO2_02_FULL_57_9]